MSRTICVAYPTIMSGMVLRWYDNDGSDDAKGVEIANAGREEARFLVFPSDQFRAVVTEAHEYLRDAYRGRLHPQVDVSRWVTHETVGVFSGRLVPVAADA